MSGDTESSVGKGTELPKLAAVLLVAALLRITALALFTDLEPFGDQLAYLGGARELLAGETYTGSRGPAYSAFLACMWWLAGDDGTGFLILRIGNLALSLLFIVLVWAVGRRLVGPRVGLVTAGLLAIHPNYVTFPLYLLSENLYNLCVVGGILLALRALRSGWPVACAAGILFGLGTLTREMLASFIPAVAVGLVYLGRARRSEAFARAIAITLGAALVILPWTARNATVHDQFLLVGFADGIPLFEGNYVPPKQLAEVRGRWAGQPIKQAKWALFHEFKQNGANTKLERNKLYREQAWKSIAARQPTWISEKLASNGPRMVSPSMQTPLLWGSAQGSGSSGFLRTVLLGSYLSLHALLFLLLPFGLARWKLLGPALLPLGYVGFSFAVHIAANAGPMRFQMPHEWILMLGAASAICSTAPIRRWFCAVLCALVLAAHAGALVAWSDLGGALIFGKATAHEDWQESFVPFEGMGDTNAGKASRDGE